MQQSCDITLRLCDVAQGLWDITLWLWDSHKTSWDVAKVLRLSHSLVACATQLLHTYLQFEPIPCSKSHSQPIPFKYFHRKYSFWRRTRITQPENPNWISYSEAVGDYALYIDQYPRQFLHIMKIIVWPCDCDSGSQVRKYISNEKGKRNWTRKRYATWNEHKLPQVRGTFQLWGRACCWTLFSSWGHQSRSVKFKACNPLVC